MEEEKRGDGCTSIVSVLEASIVKAPVKASVVL